MATNFLSISKKQKQMMKIILCYLPCCCYVLFVMPCYGDVDAGTDTLRQGQVLRDGEYLNSANKIFRLQFFSPGASSSSKFFGIFFNIPSDVRNSVTDDLHPVWVANRNNPVRNSFVMLMIDTSDGLLKISYLEGNTTVSEYSTTPSSNVNNSSRSASILDNGNLVLRMHNPDGSINRTLWQSFDYPTDTLLPGMKLGINFKTGHNWSLTSWVSDQVPATGSFTLGLDGNPNGSSQMVIWWQGNVYWTSGLWEKGKFRNTDLFGEDKKFTFVLDENENYLTYSGQGMLTKFRMDSNGRIDNFYTDPYPNCSVPWSQDPGCVMEILPKCRNVDYVRFHGKRGFITDNSDYEYDHNQNLSRWDCEAKCIQNCSCIAYTLTSNNGTGCKILDKLAGFSPSEEYGDVVYFVDKGRATWWIGHIIMVGGTFLFMYCSWCILPRNFKGKGKEKQAEKMLLRELAETNIPPGQFSGVIDKIEKKMKNQVCLFSFESLEMATNNFSSKNKLGEGGFGSVYKGLLPSGQETAIKRLSRSSGHGLLEFKNEILLIAKLQHDNLVKLLGCCTEGQEKILVYEYMPNRSLDFFLFDSSRRGSIKWSNRMNIIEGVAQGLLYLHKYSRLRVIHRDLKASNILLDQNMNPKISDFGMAKIFGKQESEANTKRIVGTQGYMSPEYAIRGVFSMKSDVFSFGVLLLEIVSGKKNHGCYHSERPLNLIGFAWELWVEGKAIELMDPTLEKSNHKSEILRCINVGLLCVQDNANDRPSMTDVITMLTNESFRLPEPKQPAFFINTNTREDDIEVDIEKACTNDLSISVMEGR